LAEEATALQFTVGPWTDQLFPPSSDIQSWDQTSAAIFVPSAEQARRDPSVCWGDEVEDDQLCPLSEETQIPLPSTAALSWDPSRDEAIAVTLPGRLNWRGQVAPESKEVKILLPLVLS
jgi:hypothetical protein